MAGQHHVLPTHKRTKTVYNDGVLHPNYLVRLLPPGMDVDNSRPIEGVVPLYRGDIYVERPTDLAKQWAKETADFPYLNSIRESITRFPGHSYLRSWMEVSATVRRCKYLADRPEEREERARRVRVCQVDLKAGQDARQKHFTDAISLSKALATQDVSDGDFDVRLYVVEDLSRDVIEALGGAFNVDPMFFRDHVDDYLWSGVAPEAMELRSLDLVTRKRCYFNLQYLRPRYYPNTASFEKAIKQAANFNVLRQLDSDRSRDSSQGPNGAAATLMRAKTSLWIQPDRPADKGILGILLIDPTLSEGYRIWGGYTSFLNWPSTADPPRTSLYNDVLFWMGQMNPSNIALIAGEPKTCALPALWLILSDWHHVVQYVTAQLGQIEWELEIPALRRKQHGLENTMKKLHLWRRDVSLYRAMVAKSIDSLFSRKMQQEYENTIDEPDWGLPALRRDFQHIQNDIDGLQNRIEGIVSVTTALLSIEEGRQAMVQNNNVARLTYLATLFIPLSFVSGFLSMAPNISELKQTFWIFFAIATPLTAIALVIADFLHLRQKVEDAIGDWRKKQA